MTNNNEIKQSIAVLVAVACIIVLYAFILTLPVWWLWNSIVPQITGGRLSDLTFLQALQLNLLFGILFRIWIPYQKKQ
jgi:hypothetical protein